MKLLWAIAYIAVLGVVSHFFGQAIPRSAFRADAFPYRCAKWERGGRVYEKLGVKRWKDALPDMSRVMPDMVKKKINVQQRAAGAGELIAETCAAELVHYCLIVLSLGIFFFWRGAGAAIFWLVYNLLGNVPFIIIQRYNRPRLIQLEERRKRRTQGA